MREKRRSIIVLLTLCFVCLGVFLGAETIDAAQISSISQAKKKALKKVPNAVVTEVDSDYEKGVLIYDVELVKGNKKYNIEYRASDAKILEYGWEKQYVRPNRNKELIGEDQCRELAYKQVKKGKIIKFVKKRDDRIDIYKLKLTQNKKRYTLVYHARTGALIEYEWELIKTSSKKQGASGSSETKNKYIGASKAKEIALAQVPGATVVKVEFDKDDGVPVYEVELIKGEYEYDFEIHAKTGKILKQEKDWRD